MTEKDPRPRLGGVPIRTIPLPILSFGLLTACQGEDSGTEAFSVVDSAGVTIVESARPLWERGEGWALSPEPEVVIGQVEGNEKYLLNQVAGVRRLSDGLSSSVSSLTRSSFMSTSVAT